MSAQQMSDEKLLLAAHDALKHSYSPYSKFAVGAALLASDGTVFSGCNVENASYGGTICAERTAFVKAVSSGYREFKAIAIACGTKQIAWPCGLCRQFMSEFGIDLRVIVQDKSGAIECFTLAELLPHHFGPKDL